MAKIQNYINGKLCDPCGDNWVDVFCPATAEKESLLPASEAIDVDMAVEAATEAFPKWASLSYKERADYLKLLASGIEANREKLARAESNDNGKPLSLAMKVDIPRAVKNLNFFADFVENRKQEIFSSDTSENVIHRIPVGVVGSISPWNLPLYILTWKIAPALAAGNCVIAKPSEVTPMTAFLFSQVCIDAGLPRGVLNIVHGTGEAVGAAMTKHPNIKAISFTGSTRTGSEISKTLAGSFKKLSLEMGGKNPTIVFSDCDFDKTVSETLRAAFSNQGQICLCGSRIYVEKLIYEKFKNQLVSEIKKLKIGDPLEPGTDQGALVSRQHYDKVISCIERAKAEGGKVLVGGGPANIEGRCKNGWFVQPTLVEGLDERCATNQEEVFGPFATIAPFESEDEVVAWANGTEYGLAGSVWTEDQDRAQRVAGRLDLGVVWINGWMERDLRTPFGGMKNSGLGREGGEDVFRFFTEAKNICTIKK